MSKQKTLFQSWGGQNSKTLSGPTGPSTSKDTSHNVIDLCEDLFDGDDDLLYEAEFSTDTIQDETENQTNISIGADGFLPTQGPSQNTTCPGFDMSAGKLWIYPTNYPVRDYQYEIVSQSLFKNTMVTLPTGLGKTFIAAVVMYNFYRWYPQGKIVFMAPTKPLVAQQIEACYNIMGIPQDHTAEMTGSMGPSKREKSWHDKRVFFLTPQVITNDLSRGSCPAHFVKCLVIDEAHKALGNHAYSQVVRELVKYTEQFRVLALSATPGSDIRAVQQVLSNLLISHIEIRTEESHDIKRYTHERTVDKIVVPLGEELTKVKAKYIHIMDVVVNKLKRHGVLYNRDTTSLSKFLILKAREAFRQNPPERLPRSQYGIVEGDFALAMSLYHGFELLQLHGSRSLYNFLEGILTGDKAYGRTRTELGRNGDFIELMEALRDQYSVPEDQTPSQAQSKPFIVGHPKMEKLQDIVLEHFRKFEAQNATTRVMIFSQYRDSVQEITDMLNLHRPQVKVMSFIGQSSAGKSTKGFTQKEQLKVMKDFREGGYNTLVSTCVGEEGLDIGDVDLIICFDAHKSPIRLVQRMGRTGRKREGRIVMLVTQGKEEQIYNQSQYNKRSIHKAILNSARSLHFYQNSPRMVPETLSPSAHKMHITVTESFKPTKKLSTDSTSKITTMFNKDKQDPSDGLITQEDYEELKGWLVPKDEVPLIPPSSDMMSLTTEDTEESMEQSGTFLSLSEWTPWQNTLQETTDLMDHSKQTKHFVELMEFVQLQSHLDPGEDPYGMEMAVFLNEDDIWKPGEKIGSSNSITKYCVLRTNEDDSKDAAISTVPTERYKKKKIRHRDTRPAFEVDENNSEGDDDLPPFSLGNKQQRLTNNDVESDTDLPQVKTSNIIDECDEMPMLIFDTDETIHVGDEIDKEQYADDLVRRIGKTGPKNGGKSFKSKAKALDQKMKNNLKSRKQKKIKSANRSVIELLKRTDENDFDRTPPDKSENRSEISNTNDLSIDMCLDNETSPVHGNDVSLHDPERKYMIRTPPTVEDAVRVCEAAELEVDMVKIDLLELIDEWHRENQNGKYMLFDVDRYKNGAPRSVNKLHKNNKVSEAINKIHLNTTNVVSDAMICERNNDSNKETASSEMSPTCNDNKMHKTNNSANKIFPERFDSSRSFKTVGTEIHSAICDDKDEKVNTMNTNPDTVQNDVCDDKGEQVNTMNTNQDTVHYDICDDKGEQVNTHTDLAFSGSFNLLEDEIDIDEAIDCQKNSQVLNVTLAIEEDNNSSKTLANKATSSSLVNEENSNPFKVSNFTPIVKKGISVSKRTSTIQKHNVSASGWVSDDSDDAAYGEISTPHFTGPTERNPEIVNKELISTTNTCNKDITNRSVTKDMTSPTIPYSACTQFTFTQALHCVQSGSLTSESDSSDILHQQRLTETSPNKGPTSIHDDSSQVSKHSKPSDISQELVSNVQNTVSGNNDDSDPSTNAESLQENVVTKDVTQTRRASISSDEFEQAQFDLGFDIDEDIIPPSPEASQPFQVSGKSRLSQNFTSRLSQSRFMSTESNISGQTANSDHANIECELKSRRTLQLADKPLLEPRVLDTLEEEEESQSILGDSAVFNDVKTCGNSNNVKKIVFNEHETSNSDSGQCKRPEENSHTTRSLMEKKREEPEQNDAFESSFALFDDDFDEWIDGDMNDSNTKSDNVSNEKSPIFDKTPKHDVDQLQIQTKEPTEVQGNQDGNETTKKSDLFLSKKKQKKSILKDTRKSLFCPGDISLEDSFDSYSIYDKGTHSKSGTSVNSRDNILKTTSTPAHTVSKAGAKFDSPAVTPLGTKNTKELSDELERSDSKNESKEADISSDLDDSFVIRKKKRKPVCLMSPKSQMGNVGLEPEVKKRDEQNVSMNSTAQNWKVTSKDTSWGMDSDFDDSVLFENNDYFGKKKNLVQIQSDSEEDFQGQSVTTNTSSERDKTLSDRKRKSKKHVKQNTKFKPKRPSNPFLEAEAELSDEHGVNASSDESDASHMDQYEGSFIQDSQFTQSQCLDQTDIQALYLKSVKSPVGNKVGGYKLQYDYQNVDVFSQMPQEEEESQYMEDSFCVGSEEDDWLGEEDYHGEITMATNQSTILQSGKKRRRGVSNLQTGRQRAIHFGRMKALDEIKSKLSKKNKQAPCDYQSKQVNKAVEKESKDKSKKRRIKMLEESSSDEDGTNKHLKNNTLISPELVATKKRKRVQLLSSSDEDCLESKIICTQSKCTSSKPWRVLDSSVDNTDTETVTYQAHLDMSCDEDEFQMDRNFDKPRRRVSNQSREQRLQRQKAQQESFRKGMAFGKGSEARETVTQNDQVNKMTKIKEKSIDQEGNTNGFESYNSTNLIHSKLPKSDTLCILVDSKELSGAQDIISDLRFKHKVQVSAAQLPGCDYVISNRMAVERKQWSDFSNGANKTKLVDRIQHLGELYDRPCLIVEKDRVKAGDKCERPQHWTKYMDRTCATLLKSQVKVLFTDTQAETASTIADLAQLEQRKGMDISVPVSLNSRKTDMVKFYASFPKLSYVHALNLCDGFESISELLKSSPGEIEQKGKMSRNRATDVYAFIQRKFDTSMLPTKHK